MDLLEPEYAEAYSTWQKDQTPTGNAAFLQTMQPVIEGAIRTHVGASNPILYSRARKLTLEGARRYDPARGRLRSHLYNHLQGLKRFAGQQTQVLRVPERAALLRKSLEETERSLTHELGREPTDAELSDHLGVSSGRLAQLRRYHPGVAEGTLEGVSGEVYGEVTPALRRASAWIEMVYDDLPPVDQKIMEYSLGLHGRRPLPNHEVARKLRLTPGAISQRKARIQAILDSEQDLSPF